MDFTVLAVTRSEGQWEHANWFAERALSGLKCGLRLAFRDPNPLPKILLPYHWGTRRHEQLRKLVATASAEPQL